MTKLTNLANPALTSARAPIISAQKWTLILKLVGLMAVANNKFTKEDMDSYQDVMMELRVVIDPSLVMTRHMVKDWLVLNKDELLKIVNGLEYDSELISIFKQIRTFPHKLDVVTGMMRVGIADGDYSRMEKMFVKKTIIYWNIRSTERADTLSSTSARRKKLTQV